MASKALYQMARKMIKNKELHVHESKLTSEAYVRTVINLIMIRAKKLLIARFIGNPSVCGGGGGGIENYFLEL